MTSSAVNAALARIVEKNCAAADVIDQAARDAAGAGHGSGDRAAATRDATGRAGFGSIGHVLTEAARLIEQRGWVRGYLFDPQCDSRQIAPVCAVGAIRVAAGGRPDWGNQASREAELAFGRYLVNRNLIAAHADPVDTIGTWNDSRANAGEVTAALRHAAQR